MKKNFKRNKILLTSLIGLAVVASASVAFSTWIFGLNKDNASIEGITVTVDGYKDTTKYIDIAAVAGETIKLAEYKAIDSSDNIAYTEGITTETGKADFDIALSKFEFAYSTTQFEFKNINFTLVAYKEADANTNINEVNTDYIHSEAVDANNTIKMRNAKTSSDKYTYLSLVTASIGKDDLGTWFSTAKNIGSYTYYEALSNKKTLSLKWSDYFGEETNASPATFYNSKYDNTYKNQSIVEKLKFLNTANSEMNAMQDAFKDTTNIKIKITATLEVTPITNPVLN